MKLTVQKSTAFSLGAKKSDAAADAFADDDDEKVHLTILDSLIGFYMTLFPRIF